jgi:FAD:protein FMN transferase
MTSPSAELRRCRPLLGTLVEIGAASGSERATLAAIDAGFAAVARVHRLMSFHEETSDVARLNRCGAGETIEVAPETHEVLRAARELQERSGGVFDVTVGPHLQRWGYLPREERDRSPRRDPTAFELLPGRRVRIRRPVRLDLGGIAKGFAVDRAVDALVAAGAVSGIVNAGGDLRAFGSERRAIHVRHPAHPGRLVPLCEIAEGAVATSAGYFARRRWRWRRVSPLVDARAGRPCLRAASVSVRAQTCTVADALTKVAMVLGRRSADILRGYAASVFFVGRDGVPVVTGSCA